MEAEKIQERTKVLAIFCGIPNQDFNPYIEWNHSNRVAYKVQEFLLELGYRLHTLEDVKVYLERNMKIMIESPSDLAEACYQFIKKEAR